MNSSSSCIAIIPARGGSKGVPAKNLCPLLGKPLLQWSIEAAHRANCVESVIVSSDDNDILHCAESLGAQALKRPAHIASDSSQSEDALLHVLSEISDRNEAQPELVVFLQCTSPWRRPGDIDNAVQELNRKSADSLFSGYLEHFTGRWRFEESRLSPINYTPGNRQMRQEAQPEIVENGSIYVFKPWVLQKHHSRLGGQIAYYEMPFKYSFQIDTLADLQLIETLMAEEY
jgi:N-acylneuraminate cytidylyltransferase